MEGGRRRESGSLETIGPGVFQFIVVVVVVVYLFYLHDIYFYSKASH